MAKVAKPKSREISVHSRAHRRQATPPPTDKSRSKSSTAEQNDHWMYGAQNAGVSKKSKAKKLTHAQRVRQSKAAERAERHMDVLEKKVAESKQKGRKIEARRQDWDDLNGASVARDAKPIRKAQDATKAEPGVLMDGVEAGFKDTVDTDK